MRKEGERGEERKVEKGNIDVEDEWTAIGEKECVVNEEKERRIVDNDVG